MTGPSLRLRERLRRTVRTWDPALARAWTAYVSARKNLPARLNDDEGPYWLRVPRWIARRCSARMGRRFLDDVLFGQSCAFLAVKIHDDLFDGHVADRSLLFAADHLLLASREAFEPHFPGDGEFWNSFNGSFRRTLNAVIAVDECQLHGHPGHAAAAALVRQGYSVCNIGSYAVCRRAGKQRLFAAVARCTGEIAVVGQFLDDLEDMNDDYRRGRVNYAAWVLLGSSRRGRRRGVNRKFPRLLLDGTGDRWFAMLRAHVRRAEVLAAQTGISELSGHVREYGQAVATAERLLHRSSVDLVFSGLL